MNLNSAFYIYSVIILFLIFTNLVYGLIDDLYCGNQDCYEVLGVSREASKSEISKTYRQLAMKFHPDRHKSEGAKEKAAEIFTLITTAYEVLKDEETRNDYDYMLENPDTVYRHYYRYYNRRMTPRVDARIVLLATIIIVSAVQYFAAWSKYKSDINYLITVPKYRHKAMEIAKQEKLLDVSKKKDRKNKEQMKEFQDNVLKKVLEEMMERNGHSKPLIMNTLAFWLICLPYTLLKYIYWNIRWFWKFNLLKHDFGDEEKLYLIRKYLQCSASQWKVISDEEKVFYLEEELWIKNNFDRWKKEKDDEMRVKLAESAKYKSYRRYMKNHGPGQLYFED